MNLLTNCGNINIDNFIKETHSFSDTEDTFLRWVPFEEFKNIKKIGQGGFSQIYKATWKIFKGISVKCTVKRSKSEREIVLKVLNNSQNVDTEFLNEVIIIYLLLIIYYLLLLIINIYLLHLKKYS
jgi:serine/threonine protein kinase